MKILLNEIRHTNCEPIFRHHGTYLDLGNVCFIVQIPYIQGQHIDNGPGADLCSFNCTAFASSFVLCQWPDKCREWLWTHSLRLHYCHHNHNAKVDLDVDAKANVTCEQGLSIYIPVQSVTRSVRGVQLRENHCMCRRFSQVTDPHLGSFNIRCV